MKKNIMVIFGGESNEYTVSLRSASAIIKNTDREKYNVYTVGISKSGKFYRFSGNVSEIESDTWTENKLNEPCVFAGGKLITVTERIRIDAAILAVHGQNCEDGKLQGYLFCAKIPYVGCDCQSSAVCMDKAATKDLLRRHNIPMVKYITVYQNEKDIVERVESYIEYPVFVKPARSGSSVGASVAKSRGELLTSLGYAFSVDDKVLVEKFVHAKETEVAILQISDTNVSVSRVGEIESGGSFYDYDTKYKKETAKYFIPARIDGENQRKVRELAKKIFTLLGCSSLARVDFFVGDEIFFNEINTLPGFTSISMYPKLLSDTGYSFSDIIDRLVMTARIK